jgi:hypothetical protein
VAGACPDNGVADSASSAPPVAATTAMITPLNIFRTGNRPPQAPILAALDRNVKVSQRFTEVVDKCHTQVEYQARY